MRKLANNGFTIIELLIATVVFSVILLIITSAIIQFSRIYYKGVIASRTQESTRNVINDIGSAVQFSGTGAISNVTPSPIGYLCIGAKRYTYRYNVQASSTQHVLVADSPASCTGPFSPMTGTLPAGASELLGEGMQLLGLNVSPVSGSVSLYNIALNVAYGQATDMVDDVKADGSAGSDGVMDRCKTIVQGGQFCAVTKLNTTVAKRVD